MAQNDKRKALYIGSDEQEWAKVLDNYFLSDLVLEGFGDEPIAKYGSYRKIPKELREKILNWPRDQKYYHKELLGVTKEKQEMEDTTLPEVDELDSRIKNLESMFKQLKEMKDRKERDDRESCGSS